MASYYSGWVASDDWRLRLDVSSSENGVSVTYTATLYIENRYMYLSGGSTYLGWAIWIDGTAQRANLNSLATGTTVRLGSLSKTVSKGTSARSVGISFSANSPNNSIAAYRSGTSGTANQTIPALASHTVSYNANGGTGAPGNQTKWYGSILTLSTVQPTRTGHNFRIWNTSSNGSGTNYSPGGQYGSDTSVTLYAQWTAHTYTVSYNANGGSGAPGNQTKTYGVNLTLSSTRPTRTNYNFKGWATSSTATSAQYQPGGTYSANTAVTLYAVWELAYTAPRITNLTASRCTSDGTLSDEGTYVKVNFNWATDRTVTLVRISCNGTNTDISSSGTSGSVNKVVGAGALDTENSYAITITVTDELGSSTASTTIAPLAYIIDFSPQGGIGLGEPAPNYAEMNSNIKLNPKRGLGFSYVAIAQNGSANLWWKLGTFNSANSQGASCIIDIYGLNGQNENTLNQGNHVCIHIIDSYDGSGYFNVTVYGMHYWVGLCDVKVLASSYSSCDVWIKTAMTYPFGCYTVHTSANWFPSNETGYSTSEPTGGHSCTIQFMFSVNYNYKNSFAGLQDGKGGDSDWVRTTSNGIIPYQQGGYSSLGTSSWPFNNLYVNNVNGVSLPASRLNDMVSLLNSKPYARSPQTSNFRIYTGTVVVTLNGSWAVALSNSAITSLIGRAFSATKDACVFMNGDNDAQNGVMVTASYRGSSNDILAHVEQFGAASGQVSGAYRVNYIMAVRD